MSDIKEKGRAGSSFDGFLAEQAVKHMDYIAIIHKDTDSEFGVSFPDFPGCVTVGKTLEDAKNMASEALAFHIEGMIEDKEAIPAPTPLDDIMTDPVFQSGAAFMVRSL